MVDEATVEDTTTEPQGPSLEERLQQIIDGLANRIDAFDNKFAVLQSQNADLSAQVANHMVRIRQLEEAAPNK